MTDNERDIIRRWRSAPEAILGDADLWQGLTHTEWTAARDKLLGTAIEFRGNRGGVAMYRLTPSGKAALRAIVAHEEWASKGTLR